MALDPRRQEIRLLTLKAGAYSSTLCCSLHVVFLNNKPVYDALSYVWGSENDPRTIQLDGKSTPVTQNLEVALRHLRLSAEDRCLWIDAVCIDQKDVSERNSQVSLMGDIYRSAEQVLIWIGEANSTSDMAFDWMPQINIDFITHSDAPEVWSFYLNAAKRPYMSRVWVVQEFVLARHDPVVLCGHKQALWSCFMSAYKILSLEFFTKLDMARDDAEGRVPQVLAKMKYDLFDELRNTVKQEGGADLRQLLIMSRTSESTDPKDRLYGLLQMLDDQDKKHFNVDYKKPTAIIYAEAVSLIFEQGDGPQFIGSMWCPSKPNPLIPHLPSWTPDLSSQTAEKAAPSPYNISFHPPFPRSVSGAGADADNGTVLDDLKTLKVEALPVDLVADVLYFGETLTACTLQLDKVEAQAKVASSRHIHDEKLRPFIERFRSSEPLWRTLVSDKKHGSGYDIAPQVYEDMYQRLLSRSSSQGASDSQQSLSEYEQALGSHLPRRTFFTTEMGFVGVGMPELQKGDQVTIWFGASVPFIVRPCEQDFTKHRLIGAAYVAGIMEGQMVDELYCDELLDSKTLFVV